MAGKFYITTTLPYVNSDPHVGFAMEIIRADIIARHKKSRGFEVFFNTGTDEHGLKIYRNAVEKGVDPQEYVDGYAQKFRELVPLLGISSDINFIRTTDAHHVKAAQEFWRRCKENGFIYKKTYKVKYCVGCELEKTESELADGKCPIHPNLEIENIEEENYFFKFSEFGQGLLEFYATHPDFVVPGFRFKEITSFVERGLEDFSISRLKAKMPWGVPVPGDDEHVMYVWFDALVNYISAIGWPDDDATFTRWAVETGGMVQYCGKDNLRQQAAMWQAMLMAAGLPNSRQIIINGFVTGDGGIKMSKSLGNTISPVDLVQDYGTDALRYFVSREVQSFEDSPFTRERFHEAYNGNLANGLGNLVARVMKMASSYLDAPVAYSAYKNEEFDALLERYEIQKASDLVWNKIQELDVHIQKTEPFKLYKTDPEAAKKIVTDLVKGVAEVGQLLAPIMPATSEKILEAVKSNQMPGPLFIRK